MPLIVQWSKCSHTYRFSVTWFLFRWWKNFNISIANLSGSTAYVTVEYSTNGGSSWTVHTDAQEADNLTITGDGSGNTSLTANVPDGSSIQWRYKSSDTSGDWSGLKLCHR